ncbi:MAG: efflux RND transporter periplasmic adaptor subunit [Acidobacteriota bacterium]
MTEFTPPMRSLAAALVAAAVTVSCSSAPPAATTPDGATPIAVRVATVTQGDVAGATEAGGVVQARTTATLAAQVLAPVAAVLVAPGDRVRTGQLLVELDGRDLEASARSAVAGAAQARDGAVAAAADERAAQAALTLARANHGRIVGLSAKRSATAQELDEAAAALAAADARAAGAAARVQEANSGITRATAASDAASATASFLRITAPFDGVITEKMVEPGNMATPGMPLLRVEDTRGFRLEVRVDESRAASIRMGGAVDVVLDGADGRTVTLAGVVAEISRALDAGARSFLVKVTLPVTPDLRSGAFGRARFPDAARTALTIPAEAIVQQGQVSAVFVANDGVARLRLVRMRGTEVEAGLSAGEIVILAPPPGLTDGRRITAEGAR